ncbi:MAG: T9SS type A sorting domain-containing protein [Candidatus Latescibacteria bacterium]|nr:T9SS type A sorting domain-containing protein [Candidatus Latescibacterota bacterium]
MRSTDAKDLNNDKKVDRKDYDLFVANLKAGAAPPTNPTPVPPADGGTPPPPATPAPPVEGSTPPADGTTTPPATGTTTPPADGSTPPAAAAKAGGMGIPQDFALGANYPNPFNPETTIGYQLPATVQVRLEIYDVLGQKVRTLVQQVEPAGYHSAVWDGRDDAGQALAGGIYLYRLQAEQFSEVRRLLLLK